MFTRRQNIPLSFVATFWIFPPDVAPLPTVSWGRMVIDTKFVSIVAELETAVTRRHGHPARLVAITFCQALDQSI